MTDQLPQRLNAGDPAPADCVAVPIHGPSHDTATWREIATVCREGCLSITAEALEQVAESLEQVAEAAAADPPDSTRDGFDLDEAAWVLIANAFNGNWDIASDEWRQAAEQWRDRYHASLAAEPPLKPGDRVRVTFEATVVSTEGASVEVDTPQGPEFFISPEHVTRIDDSGASAGPSRPGDKPEEIHAPESPQTLTEQPADWDPTEGMLIERISDGECFRLERLDEWVWRLHSVGDASPDDAYTAYLREHFRRRFLRVGDVIEKVKWSDPLVGDPYKGQRITKIGPLSDGEQYIALEGGWPIISPRTIHIVGLGPVPWPPAKEADRD